MTFTIRPASEADVDQHGDLREEAYGMPAGTGRVRAHQQAEAGLLDRMLGAYLGERLVGGLVILPYGQFFGGRPVPMGGVSGVVVAADQRGRGVGRALMDAALAYMREHGEVISALGPATVAIYRAAGWELAGDMHVYTMPTRDLALLPSTALVERPACAGDDDAIKRAYVRFAATRNGMLARPAVVWGYRIHAPQAGQRRYVVERNGEVTGYLSYTCHSRATHGYTLVVDDFAALDWESERTLWRHLAGHRAQTESVTIIGLPVEVLSLHLPEQTITRTFANRWMLRVVNAAGAISARGFAPSLHASVPLTISDPRVPLNDGDWVLEVDGGRGTLTRSNGRSNGSVGITINGLAPLFSSATSARTLAAAGAITGAAGEQLATLDAMFAGPTPAMNDRF